MSKVISLNADPQLSEEVVEAARSVVRKPKALLTLFKSLPPLSKATLSNPEIIHIYPYSFIQWSLCMHGLADWEELPVLSYADYVIQQSYGLQPTDIAIGSF